MKPYYLGRKHLMMRDRYVINYLDKHRAMSAVRHEMYE